jgi:hypothetical protein
MLQMSLSSSPQTSVIDLSECGSYNCRGCGEAMGEADGEVAYRKDVDCCDI